MFGHVYFKLSVGHTGGKVEGPWVHGCGVREDRAVVPHTRALSTEMVCRAVAPYMWDHLVHARGKRRQEAPGWSPSASRMERVRGTGMRGCNVGDGPREIRTWEPRAEGRREGQGTKGWM